MKAIGPFIVMLVVAGLAWGGATVAVLRPVVGTVVPALAVLIFLAGFAIRVVRWARTPVPFRIPTTCGQQRSLPWIRSSWIESPWTRTGVVVRMALEVLLFRSLFRNTRGAMTTEPVVSADASAGEAPDRTSVPARLVYGEQKWLWLAAMVFHWSILVVVLRHLRFFVEPVPALVGAVTALDGFFEVGAPVVYATDVMLPAALAYLLWRRLNDAQMRYISLFQDYFALYLLLGLVGTGVLMRYGARPDIVAIKQMTLGLVTLAPVLPERLGPLFFVHLSLLSVLLAYFPFSKLMHMAGVFLSPTRNLANNSRMRRHLNPWNYPVQVHTYEQWEDEFRVKMKSAGLPVEKE